MFQNKTKNISKVIVTVDLLLLLVSILLAKSAGYSWELQNNFYIFFTVSCLFIWMALALKLGLYDLPRIIQLDKIINQILNAFVCFSFLSSGLIFIITENKFSRSHILVFLVSFFFFILIWRVLFVFWLKYTRRKGNLDSKIVIVGIDKNMTNLINKVYLNRDYGYNILGVFTDTEEYNRDEKYTKGKLIDVFDFLEKNKTDQIIISLPHTQNKLLNDLLKYADNSMIRVRVIPEFSEYLSQVFTIDYIQNVPVMKLRREPLQSLTNRVLKRVFDFIIATLTILLVFSWLFPMIALIIKFTSRGPVFFSQMRTGKDGVPFRCLKFRSMEVNDESDDKQAVKGDKRITRFGAFMRRTSVDELPQIVNVFFNQMSLVGPRPHMLKHTEEYKSLIDKFMLRHFAKPGVTGWAQINGLRGETKHVSDMAKRAEADIWYIENWNFMLDVKIILITAWSMLFKKDDNAF